MLTASGRGVSDYLPRLVEALRRRGAPQDTIDRRVFALEADRGTQSVRCRHCNSEVVVHSEK